MRKRFIFILICCILVNTIFSQQIIPIQYDTTEYTHEFILSGTGEISSTSLRNEFTSKLILGGEITNQIKQSTFSKHHIQNRVGMDVNSEIEYRNMKVNLFKNNKIGFLIKGGYFAIGSANYSKDLFDLTFNGNSLYNGKTANFSGSSLSFFNFQKIGFGCINKITKSNFLLNYFNVSNYYSGEIQQGELSQNEDGTLVSLTLNGKERQTIGSDFVKGIGVGIDIDYRFNMLLNEQQKSTFQFIAKNIGVVNFTKELKSYNLDSTYTFEGLKLNQLYGSKTVFKDSVSILDTLNIHRAIEKKVIVLPGFLQFGKIVNENFKGKWQSFYGIKLFPTLAYNPMLYVGAHFSPSDKIEFGSQFSVGGFSIVKMGFYSNFKISKWSIGVATQDLYGVLTKKGYGKSFLIRLRCKI